VTKTVTIDREVLVDAFHDRITEGLALRIAQELSHLPPLAAQRVFDEIEAHRFELMLSPDGRVDMRVLGEPFLECHVEELLSS
jgi:hypothetical protein